MKQSVRKFAPRRPVLAGGLVAAVILALVVGIFLAGDPVEADPQLTVYKNPSCHCCNGWVDHLERAGFEVDVQHPGDLDRIRAQFGIAPQHAGCHTATIGNYVIEGHVPAEQIERLLRERPAARGLAVPGMPAGSPGMEGPYAQPYEVLLIAPDGSAKTYARYPAAAGNRQDPSRTSLAPAGNVRTDGTLIPIKIQMGSPG